MLFTSADFPTPPDPKTTILNSLIAEIEERICNKDENSILIKTKVQKTYVQWLLTNYKI
jgi:hypothetical protein